MTNRENALIGLEVVIHFSASLDSPLEVFQWSPGALVEIKDRHEVDDYIVSSLRQLANAIEEKGLRKGLYGVPNDLD